jgi:ribonuclease PH
LSEIIRSDGRKANQLRPVKMIPNYVVYPEGSLLIEMGETRVLCNVTVEDGAPRWMQYQGISGGWVTAEYALLPRSTQERTSRETRGLRGRTQEIRRLIGRSLRAAVDLHLLGERTCIVDCDVIQADGGTRTAAITGGYVALKLALSRFVDRKELPPEIFQSPIAAISVGIVGGNTLLDLCYREDSTADVDVNVVMNDAGHFIELQGTAEKNPFTRVDLDKMLDLAYQGIQELFRYQQDILMG